VIENAYLLNDFVECYGYVDDENYTQEEMELCAERRDETFPANSTVHKVYGDDDGDIVGGVYDYILRDGGESENFVWRYKESYR
jgi:hypothetical protein